MRPSPHVTCSSRVPYSTTKVVRSAHRFDRAASVLLDVRSAIGRESSQLAVQQMTTMKHIFDLALGPTGQVVTLVSLLAGLALVLGAVGVYGVISHYVVRRSREYGIRIALGQQPLLVIRQVVGRGAALVALGSAIGIALAFGASRLLASLLYGVQPTDPVAMVGAIAVLLAVGMLAAFVPARRASLTDPAWCCARREVFGPMKSRREPGTVLLGSLEEQVMLAVVRTGDDAYGI